MYAAEVTAASKAAAGKRAMLSKNPIGYFVLSMLAGAYIGFGNILINVIGGQLAGSPATKTAMSVSFGIALSLVVIAGSELFTGNTMVMSLGIMKKTVTLADAAKVWIVCWLGNLAGAVVLALLFHFSGLNGEATPPFLDGCCRQDEYRLRPALHTWHPLQYPRLPGSVVLLQDHERCREAHHGLLVPLCLYHLWLRALCCQHDAAHGGAP